MEIKTYYIIQAIDTKKYYGIYRGDQYWTGDIDDATHYNSEEEAIYHLKCVIPLNHVIANFAETTHNNINVIKYIIVLIVLIFIYIN